MRSAVRLRAWMRYRYSGASTSPSAAPEWMRRIAHSQSEPVFSDSSYPPTLTSVARRTAGAAQKQRSRIAAR